MRDRLIIPRALAFAIALAPIGRAQEPVQPLAEDRISENGAGSSAMSFETQELHILPGRSLIVNTQKRMQRVLVTNPAVIQTLTASPTQLVVMGKDAGAGSVIIWDIDGRPRVLDISVDVDVSALRDAIQQAFPREAIQTTADRQKVVLSGVAANKAIADEVSRIATSYTKDVVSSVQIPQRDHPRQVLLKVRFAEVDRTKLDQFGINFLSTGAAKTPGIISTQQFGPPGLNNGTVTGTGTTFSVGDLLNIFLFRPDINLGATIRDLQQKNVLQILAEPNLLAIDGQPAKFLAGGEFPFPVVQGGLTGGTNAITIQFRPFGVQLQFQAMVGNDNSIRLKVAPEVSALDFTNALTISGFVIPAISTRRAETEIELKDGQSFGIAGMLDHRTTAQLSKLPGIADIPILGKLFRSKSISNTSTELVVIVTPSIVDPVAQANVPATPPKNALPMLDEEKFDKSVGKTPKETSPAQTRPQ